MQRVLVLGNGGAGKSYLAVALGARLGLDVVHLDRLFWRPGWTKSATEAFVDAQRHALPSDGRWIADGTYLNTLEVRLPHADTVVVLDVPTVVCLRRVVARTLAPAARPDMAPGCPERLLSTDYVRFLRYVATYRQRVLPRALAKLSEIEHAARVVTLRRPDEIARFIRADS